MRFHLHNKSKLDMRTMILVDTDRPGQENEIANGLIGKLATRSGSIRREGKVISLCDVMGNTVATIEPARYSTRQVVIMTGMRDEVITALKQIGAEQIEPEESKFA